MNTLTYTHLEKEQIKKVTDHLQLLLADYQVFYTNLRGFHWNIKGDKFFVLHAKFEQMYTDFAEKVDDLAERLLTLGVTPESRFSQYLAKARIKETETLCCADDVMRSILESYSQIIQNQRELMSIAEEAKDDSTASMMSDFIREQEKFVWMLVAYFTQSCKN
ncbi:MAG: Dps family protein [Rikenellaceae bacterium]